ncbi:twin-arginine translocation signal domain-containing protein [Corticibacter populi]|uniref:Twin-arginine translocation signal domain-containing protein n=1 Tax=Corticibacter populi TaxID=1550736 RepID=A0A3M6QKB6_9BURK|nr:gluconate 2-dehydrogenase subunit 3 family protein [Corticibacter populi]RMX02959.1 twin-arginine translocation signal domain-containing protein [Corticibacter populi]RZS33379.1 gluconate 2-dehydrogenase gamma chain [Corticibacter populi]
MSDPHGYQNRRNFLKASAAGVALTGVPVALHAKSKEPPVPLDQYKTEYFTADEWAFVLAATARLIPSEGDGPGAIEARVPVFIDRQLAGDYGRADDWYMVGPHDPTAEPARGWQTPLNPAQLYRQAIPAFNAWCEEKYGKSFTVLEAAQQDEALTALQKGEVAMNPELSIFFTTLLANTKEGYFADPIHGGNQGMQSWSYIGFPGARASYKEWVDQHNVKYPLGPVSISGERA